MKNKSFPIAILQGRLSPDLENRYQFFPKNGWQEEFTKAKELGFDGIEWLIDPNGWLQNPIFDNQYTDAITTSEKILPIVSICADWCMNVCIWEDDPEAHRAKIRSLFSSLKATTNKLLLIPLLETHDIRPTDIQKKVVSVLKPLSRELEEEGIRIGFETELSSKELTEFLSGFESDAFGVYYDVGNCTSYGFDCPSDIRHLGTRIFGVHLKDRRIGTTTPLPLGSGDVNFFGIVEALNEINWKGTLVMQAWRGERYLNDAIMQLNFIRKILIG